MEWVIVLLIISVILNYFLILAYIEQSKKYSGYDEYVKEMEKLYGSLEKITAKHRKTFKKGK